MKKLPIIGLVFGAIAALFAVKKKKSGAAEEETAAGEEQASDTQTT